jgi:hypothetical protein
MPKTSLKIDIFVVNPLNEPGLLSKRYYFSSLAAQNPLQTLLAQILDDGGAPPAACASKQDQKPPAT